MTDEWSSATDTLSTTSLIAVTPQEIPPNLKEWVGLIVNAGQRQRSDSVHSVNKIRRPVNQLETRSRIRSSSVLSSSNQPSRRVALRSCSFNPPAVRHAVLAA